MISRTHRDPWTKEHSSAPAVPAQPSRAPTLVVSLDFELHWGVRDVVATDDAYAASLRGARAAIPAILTLFARYRVSATWATVGFLFARDRRELFDHAPVLRPTYRDTRFSAYGQPIGNDENDDPLHFAPSLIERIAGTPRQEVGSHTFSHYYCLEEGQAQEHFAADLAAARSLARERGIDLRSLVLPRNQLNRAYLPAVRDAGFVAYRGNPRHWALRERAQGGHGIVHRLVRLADSYATLTGHHVHAWDALDVTDGVVDVPASLFFRPAPGRAPGLGSLITRRVIRAMDRAAQERGIFHLWWHPHNFGRHTDRRLAELEQVLVAFRRLADTRGMVSRTMQEVADAAARR